MKKLDMEKLNPQLKSATTLTMIAMDQLMKDLTLMETAF